MRFIYAACALTMLIGCNNSEPVPSKQTRSAKSANVTSHVGDAKTINPEDCDPAEAKLRKQNCPTKSSSRNGSSGENCPNGSGGSNCPPSSGDSSDDSWNDEDSGDENCPNGSGGSNCPPSSDDSSDDSWNDEDSGDENCPMGGGGCP